MFVLDTDILSLMLQSHPKVLQRVAALSSDQALATSIISRIEVLRGRFEWVLKAANKDEWLRAQKRLVADEEHLSHMDIVFIDEAAADEFERLLKVKKLRKMGRSDLLISSIVLSKKATLITRNAKDFRLVPGLTIENWAD